MLEFELCLSLLRHDRSYPSVLSLPIGHFQSHEGRDKERIRGGSRMKEPSGKSTHNNIGPSVSHTKTLNPKPQVAPKSKQLSEANFATCPTGGSPEETRGSDSSNGICHSAWEHSSLKRTLRVGSGFRV